MQLRELQEGAIARAEGSQGAREISIDRVATGRWATSRTAIYSALSGTRLPSVNTLCAAVSAWHPLGEKGIPEWLKLRRDVEEQLITLRGGPLEQAAEVVALPSAEPVAPPDEEALAELRILLANARARARLTMTALAARAGLGRTTVHQALAPGSPVPSASTVAALSKALNLNIDDVLELRRRAAGEVR
ncbi:MULTISPECIES: helix-turn-helix transcriptional regulator [unclassified Streptomyces]|uniref:helix-turn-helix transcriptional regulator n=1 Tax=unclassified Streptomyces TaxID=2593676 RepID=UPI00093AB5DA|nr:helix-turn-helix transcriptional regulator [Streptomyces sp. CB02058]OKI93741.1 hypothetical protein AMK10_15225 [Streptomyces sp. CB02058]